MSDLLNIASSGLDAANALTAVYAGNLANLNTSGYQPREVDLAESPDSSGVTVVDIVALEAPIVVQGSDQSDQPESAVDPVAQAINFRRAESLYTANAQVIQASEQMFGNLLNLLDTEQTGPPEVDTDNVL